MRMHQYTRPFPIPQQLFQTYCFEKVHSKSKKWYVTILVESWERFNDKDKGYRVLLRI